MKNLLETVIGNNTIGDYLISLMWMVAIVLVRKWLARGAAWFFSRMIARKERPFDRKKFQELVLGPIGMFMVVFIILAALYRLHMPDALRISIYKTSLTQVLESVAKGVLISSFIWLCNRIIIYVAYLFEQKALRTPERTDDQLVVFFRDFMQVLVWIGGSLLMLKYAFGFNLSNVLTGLSIVGAALALAFRESLENLIASFVIFFDKPFTVGDLVKVESVLGTVESIGLRSTRIRTTDKTYVTMPNKKMVDSILDNQSQRTHRHVQTRLEIFLQATPADMADYMAAAGQWLERQPVEEPLIYLADTGGAAHIIQVEYFVEAQLSIREFQKLKEQVCMELISLLPRFGLELAGMHRGNYPGGVTGSV